MLDPIAEAIDEIWGLYRPYRILPLMNWRMIYEQAQRSRSQEQTLS